MSQAVREALEAGFSQIHLMGNCLAVIQAVNRKDPCMSYAGTIIADVKQLLNLYVHGKHLFVENVIP